MRNGDRSWWVPLVIATALAGCRTSASVSASGTVNPGEAEAPRDDPAALDAEPGRTSVDLSGPLEAIRKVNGVPGLAAAVVSPRGVEAIGAAGVRRADEAAPLQPDDVFHLGSNSKAITTFALGRLVAQDKIGWDRTVTETLEVPVHVKLRGVTLQQLLLHRAGLPVNVEPSVLGAVEPTVAARGLRQEIARIVLQQPPVHPPGKAFLYSNTGYIVAGAMMESALDLSWETVVQREVFDPLGMTSCGFGPTASQTDRDAPWAHRPQDDGQWEPTAIDNPPFYGPAGTVHCSLPDWGRFAVEQFNEGPDALLPPEILIHLHEGEPLPDRDGRYALGWIITQSPLADGPVWTHDGSNTVNYASVLVLPQRRLAIVAASNAGGPKGQQAVVSAVSGLLQTFGRKPADDASAGAQTPADASSMAPSTADMTASVRPPVPSVGR